MFDINSFVNEYVIHRDKSMFEDDIRANEALLLEKIKDKTILVIGGAGSIGSSFIKAVVKYKPSVLCVVDINENALTELTRDLRSGNYYIPEKYLSYPMDYSSKAFEKMFRKNGGFDVVANFSAHKHVRSEKDVFSIEALLMNNVVNARKLLGLLKEFKPNVYFCVSTDKAANPVNVMGASKRIMEDLIFSYSDFFPVKTARFANVAFSNGSLPAGFIERLSKLQPISAPSDVRRYFVSMEESGQICMMAAFLGDNREIFFPKLDKAKMERFDVIAERFLNANGYAILRCNSEGEVLEKAKSFIIQGGDYPVYFSVSDTSGEKEYEEFYTSDEIVDLNSYKNLGVIKEIPLPDKERIEKLIIKLENIFSSLDVTKQDIVDIISSYLPSFNHIEKGKSLDEKM